MKWIKFMMKRGNGIKRKIDALVGISLVFFLNIIFYWRKLLPKRININKVGVLIFGAIGDASLALTITQNIQKNYPLAKIIVYLSEENVAASMLFETVEVKVLNITTIFKNLIHIRNESFDIWVDTSQWARISAIYSFFSKSKFSVGFKTSNQFRHFLYDCAVTHRDEVHEIENFIGLLQALQITSNSLPSLDVSHNDLASNYFEKSYIVVHLYASGYLHWMREWPNEYWEELVNTLNERGYYVVFTGSKNDLIKINEFLKNFSDKDMIHVAAGRYSLKEVLSILKNAYCVISVNTSIVHLSSLVGAKIIALNGPTNSRRWGAWGSNSININVPKSKGGGFLNLGFEYPKNPKYIMDEINPQEVIYALKSFENIKK